MQKLRLQNIWDDVLKSFDKSNFDLRESEKAFTGKVKITSKDGDDFNSLPMKFIAFKSKIDKETEFALRESKGHVFEVDYGLTVKVLKDKKGAKVLDKDGRDIRYFQMIINKARFENKDYYAYNQAKADGYQPQVDLSEEIPF